MKREFLFACYQSPRGKLLRDLEIQYLKHVIDAGCKEYILQISGLNWENEFIDCSLFQNFYILDKSARGWNGSNKIQTHAFNLPIQSASIDWILLPHILEFDAHRFQTMREVERILKPEGHLIIITFNPWSLWLRTQYLWDQHLADSWHGNFISRSRLLDWLKLLNFEIKTHTEFNLDNYNTIHGRSILGKNTLFSNAYAIKAVKRRYTLTPVNKIQLNVLPLNVNIALKSNS